MVHGDCPLVSLIVVTARAVLNRAVERNDRRRRDAVMLVVYNDGCIVVVVLS